MTIVLADRRFLLGAVALVTALVLLPCVSTSADAATAGQLSARISELRRNSEALARAPFDAAAESALVDRLDTVCDDFHEAAVRGASLRSSALALPKALQGNHDRYTKVLEAMQAEVIRVDGDLEAVQDSPAWRERELLAMRIQYRLNWVHFELGARYESSSSRRDEHLRKARNGFGEFLGSGRS